MEKLGSHPIEQAVETAISIGRFVVDRVIGGAWAEIAKPVEQIKGE